MDAKFLFFLKHLIFLQNPFEDNGNFLIICLQKIYYNSVPFSDKLYPGQNLKA